MKNIVAITGAAAFAATAPATTAKKGKAGAPKAEDRVAPEFTAVRTDIKPPVTARRGAKSPLVEKMHELEIGASIGLKNKTKRQISATVSKENNRDTNQRPKLGEDGNQITKPGEPVKDANGNVVAQGTPVGVTERIKEWEAHDVDPKTDPDSATVRVFRVK
jgi:hypothetical protein